MWRHRVSLAPAATDRYEESAQKQKSVRNDALAWGLFLL